jgi:flagellar basal-body rod modification protein FlgD
MTDPIAARVAPTMTVNQALAGASGSGTTAKSPTDAMGSDTFLKLLVAQLKYQDPSKPADATAMMGQTAQFQMVEKLQQLADQNTQMLSEQQATSAIALVGRSVSYTLGDRTLHGVVDSLRLTAGGPVLAIGSAEVPLASVSEISAAGAATAGTAT